MTTPRRRKGVAVRSLALLVAGQLAVSACTATGGSTTPTPSTPQASSSTQQATSSAQAAPSWTFGPVAWGTCTDQKNWDANGWDAARLADRDVRCGTLSVPRDHANPSDGTLGMAVVRVRANRQHDRLGALVFNPGGPGGSGLDFMPYFARWVPDELLERFDLVSFDPRGVVSSQAFDCGDDPAPGAPPDVLPDVLTEAGFAQGQAWETAHSQACAEQIAARRTSFGTDAVARDMDLLRAALGDEKLTYVGWSYGARLGAHYAHLFPDRVRALILDAPPHPSAQSPEVVDAQLDGFESTLSAYVQQCPSRASCAKVGGDPRKVLERVVSSARQTPITSYRPSGDPPATWNVVLSSVLSHLQSPSLWPVLDEALGDADRGDAGTLYDAIDTVKGKTPAHPDTDTRDVQQAVQCTDIGPTRDLDSLRGQAVSIVADHPTFGSYGAWWLFHCSTWTAPRVPLPAPTTTTTGTVLVIAGEADPTTPLAGAQALREALGSAAGLLVSSTTGHTSFGPSGCVNAVVVRVLVDATSQGQPTRCT